MSDVAIPTPPFQIWHEECKKVLESLGEIRNDKQPSKKNQKTPKSSNNKQAIVTGTEKSKSQRRSYEKTSTLPSSEIPNEKISNVEDIHEIKRQGEMESNSKKSSAEEQRKAKSYPDKRDRSADQFYDNPQVQEMLNFSRNFVLVDHDSGAPGDLKRQASRSTENLSTGTFTTVVKKRDKYKSTGIST